MNKYSEVIGLPIISVDDGKRIGTVKDMIFCPQIRTVKAILLERKGYNIGKKVILVDDIISLGKDAVIVNDASCIKDLRKLEDSEELKYKGEINGLRIFTKSGQDMGVVKDVIFDCATGLIEGVEVSDGLIQDIIRGRNIMPLFGKVEFSDENLLVDKEAIEEMVETGGGLKNLLNND